ncbi:MAG: amidohydrolase [Dehalococcoidales bacterium]|nr:amidohydrolase [Dehalococcoidales bacterium]
MSFRYNIAMIIDVHTHIFSPRVKANRDLYTAADPCFATLYSSEKAALATADELLENMDREEIDISVICNIGWTSHELCVESNDYIMESVARFPKRLIGFCSVVPDETDTSLVELERCLQGGIRGVGEMRPDVQGVDLDDAGVMESLVRMMVENDLVFLAHASEPVGHQYQGKGEVTPEALYPFITRYPELKIILAHWGGGLPFYYLMPEVKKASANVYFDTAASPYLYFPDIYKYVTQLAGADKILFGSDYPLLKPSRYIKEIDAAGLSPETKERILAGNAIELLGIDAK